MLATSDQPLTEHQPVDLADLSARLTTHSADAARQAGIDIHTAAAPAPVAGDPVLLERLAQNLIDNAIRYNLAQHGHIWITTGSSDGHACLTVDNTGPTVPADEIGELFEPFRRLTATDRLADHDPTRPGRGAGLGLSIVRSVALAHHGQVRANPRPDGGLTIQVRIPSAKEQAGQRPRTGAAR